MSNKITGVRIKYIDGTYSNEIPISTDVGNVKWDSSTSLADILGALDITDGTVKAQLDRIVYESKAAAQGGTTLSLVTTGDKYNWNHKTDNTGTVEQISTGVGLAGGPISVTGTVKANLNSEASKGTIGVTDRLYDIGIDTNGKLCVSVPWTDTTYSAATATPNMDGTGAVGISTKYAREDHTHPTDTTRVPTTRKINNKELSADITLTPSDVSSIPMSYKGNADGVAELDENGLIISSQLPSFVDDVLEYNSISDFPVTGETGKIYVALNTNITYRWGGTGYVQISSSLALGQTSSTAYRGDRGKTAYDHATDSSRLTTAQTSGLYKIATTEEGHVAGVTAVQKQDITGLGIPAQDTVTTVTTSGLGNAITSLTASNGALTASKETTFLTQHQTIKQDGVTGATTNRYATCSDLAATAAKTASITTGTFSLETGGRVTVKFENANTADNPTLNINNTGVKNIYYKGSQITNGAEKELLANVVDFIYDGTQWNLIANSSVFVDVTNAEIDEIITGVTPSATGYITNAEIDEIIGNVPAASVIYLLNNIYPVGTYYETSDENFNPNVSFGGTWELDPDAGAMVIDEDALAGTVDGDLVVAITNAGITNITSTNSVYRWHRTF